MTQENKTKKILSIIGNVVIWIIVAFSLLTTIFVIVAQNNKDGVPELFGKSFITIQTDSMEDTYKAGDMVFLTKLSDEEKKELKEDDIITFFSPLDINKNGMLGDDINTHRIERIENGKIYTQGDNPKAPIDELPVEYGEVIGICTEEGKISGFGGVMDFLRSSLGFFLCVVLPMLLFFLYELYNFITLLAQRKVKAGISQETEEEIKRKAIEEYLAQQNAPQAPVNEAEPQVAEKNKDENA